ncbi:MAG: sugar ABC transporter permease [Chloroflexi bacterium]|nr:sugar ABC transporter permease [Chloroflexota bacterium]MDA8218799.1 sugar ABC transporter permease [Dehalococcoidales bacterium]
MEASRSATAAPGRRGGGLGELIDRLFPYWAVVPLVGTFLLLTAYPITQLFAISLTTYNFAQGAAIPPYAGLVNYGKMVEDEIFGAALRNTFVFVAAAVTVEFVLGFGLALLVERAGRLTDFYRTLFILPIIVPPIAIGTMWRLMYQRDFGIINSVLHTFGLPSQNWLADPNFALGAVVIVDVWHWTGFVFLIMAAGLQSLPREPYEAARVDGASSTQTFRFLTLPLLRSTIMVAVVLRMIFAFKVFDEIFLLTTGGPGHSTEVVSVYIQKVVFKLSEVGYGAWLAVVTIAIVAVFVLIYIRLLREKGASS